MGTSWPSEPQLQPEPDPESDMYYNRASPEPQSPPEFQMSHPSQNTQLQAQNDPGTYYYNKNLKPYAVSSMPMTHHSHPPSQPDLELCHNMSYPPQKLMQPQSRWCSDDYDNGQAISGTAAWAQRANASCQTDMALPQAQPKRRPKSGPSSTTHTHTKSMPALRPKSGNGKPTRAASASKASRKGAEQRPLSSSLPRRPMNPTSCSDTEAEPWSSKRAERPERPERLERLERPERPKRSASHGRTGPGPLMQSLANKSGDSLNTRQFFHHADAIVGVGHPLGHSHKKTSKHCVQDNVVRHVHHHSHIVVAAPLQPGEHVVFPLRPRSSNAVRPAAQRDPAFASQAMEEVPFLQLKEGA